MDISKKDLIDYLERLIKDEKYKMAFFGERESNKIRE